MAQHGPLWNRRHAVRWLLAGSLAMSAGGCAAPWFRREKDQVEEYQEERDRVKTLWRSPERPRTIDEFTRKIITMTRIENVALVTGLPNTGGKVAPSSQRERMLDIMRRHNVTNPNQLLDDPSTALVTAEVLVPPAARKDNRLSVIVKLSKHAEATNLQGGWLLNTELVEMSVLGGEIKSGFGFAMAQGQLVTQQQITGEASPEAATRAMVVGGARLMQSRSIGLAIEERFAHPITIRTALMPINKRFTVFDGSSQIGVGKPINDTIIELAVPPRYRHDPDHFANVIQHLGVAESPEQERERLDRCGAELLERTTARRAAYQLEAAGKGSIELLLPGLNHPDKEIQFYAAHALAYLNDARSIPVLTELARSEPAFRAMCLNGLTVVESYRAGDALEELLSAPQAETRYGALLALREHDSQSPLVRGQAVGQVGSILEVPTSGPNLVVVGLNLLPEIVIFGPNPPLNVDGFLYINPRMMLRNLGGGRMTVSHLVPGREDRTAECTADVASVLRAVAEVGGTYGDWVNFVRLCGSDKLMSAEVAMNPVPIAGRKYERDLTGGGESAEAASQTVSELNNLPVLTDSPSDDRQDNDAPGSWINPLSWFGGK